MNEKRLTKEETNGGFRLKKILLIGKPGDIIRSINEYLDKRFTVQMCFDQIEMMEDMVKVFRPDMMIYCQASGEDVNEGLLEWLSDNPRKKPVLVICTKEEWETLRNYCEGSVFYHVLSPVQTSVIATKCTDSLSGKGDQSAKDMTEDGDEGSKKIMVIDDCSFVLRNVKHMLEETYQVFVAPSGEKAMTLLPKTLPDLILLDYEMPGWSGKETYERILEVPELCDIPVIFLTSVSDRQRVVDILKRNPAGYILKPIERDMLLDKIEAVLAHV